MRPRGLFSNQRQRHNYRSQAPCLLPSQRGKSGRVFYPEYTQEEKAPHWALDRLAGWELPGREHVEEYFWGMYRRNFRPKKYFSALTAIYVFLTVIRDSGKTSLKEITKNHIATPTLKAEDHQLLSEYGLSVLSLPRRRRGNSYRQPCKGTEYHEASQGASQASERRIHRDPFQKSERALGSSHVRAHASMRITGGRSSSPFPGQHGS